MNIDTKMILGNSSIGRNISVIDERKDMFQVLSTTDKIISLLKDGRLLTSEISDRLILTPRCIRKNLAKLEKSGYIERSLGKPRNCKFRHSDSWSLKKNVGIVTKVPASHLCLWYKTNHYLNGFKHHYILLPKTINLDNNLALSLGFFTAEGSKTKPRSIEVTNNEPCLISCFTDTIRIFDVDKEKLSWRVVFNKKFKNVFDGKEMKDLENLSKTFWTSNCGLKDEKFTSFNYTGNSFGGRRKRVSIWGTLTLSYNDLLTARFLFRVFDVSKKFILEDKNLALNYLRGYLSGEAYVGLHDREIQFASVNNEDLDFAQKALAGLGIKSSLCNETSTSPRRVIITSIKDFLALEEMDIFKFHLYKKMALLRKLSAYKKLEPGKNKEIQEKIREVEEPILKRENMFKKFILKYSS